MPGWPGAQPQPEADPEAWCLPFSRAVCPPADPGAGHAGRQNWRSLADGGLGIQAHWCGTLCQGHEGRGWWPQELGRSGRLQCSRQQALAESGLDCGWQGALARRQLAAATAARLVFHSSPNHCPAHPAPPQALVKHTEVGGRSVSLARGPLDSPCVQPQPCSSKAPWAGDDFSEPQFPYDEMRVLI